MISSFNGPSSGRPGRPCIYLAKEADEIHPSPLTSMSKFQVWQLRLKMRLFGFSRLLEHASFSFILVI